MIFLHFHDSSLQERVTKVRALYERAGTPGEKAAAAEALRRMGEDLDERPKGPPELRIRQFVVYMSNTAQNRTAEIRVGTYSKEGAAESAKAKMGGPGNWYVDRVREL